MLGLIKRKTHLQFVYLGIILPKDFNNLQANSHRVTSLFALQNQFEPELVHQTDYTQFSESIITQVDKALDNETGLLLCCRTNCKTGEQNSLLYNL